jgi:phosphoribosylaminoimidazolecarboxamide formyltransferase/IMP cyclohydrolase
MSKIERALLSVYNKEGLLELARTLAGAGVEILSTGGTAQTLIKAGLKVVEVAQYTGAPQILDGRVKSLHPKIYAGLLFRRDLSEHDRQMREFGFGPIDLLAVNLYPFEEAVARPGTTLAEALENIDIGGPCLLRAGAKNFASVTVICDSCDYARVEAEIKARGQTTPATRRELAKKAFLRTQAYDRAISDWLETLGDSS